MPKILTALLLMGIGYLIAVTPSVWPLIGWLMPILSICLFALIVFRVISPKDGGT